MIELALCLFLVALGAGGWLAIRVGRRIHGHQPPGPDSSFWRRLMTAPPPRQPSGSTEERRPADQGANK